ncbi:MAG: hypothetical protein ACJAVI_001229, partial [Candidatus Azotimanducaceae bacterium]
MKNSMSNFVKTLIGVQVVFSGAVMAANETPSKSLFHWLSFGTKPLVMQNREEISQPKNDLPSRLTRGTVLYHYFQDNLENATSAALYEERSKVNGESVSDNLVETYKFTLMRAGLALDMGDETQAERILNELPAEDLTKLDKSRWHYQLARQAYRGQNWGRLEAEISQIDSNSHLRRSARFKFLQAELHSAQGEFSQASRYITEIDSENVLSRYAQFNLGLSAYRQGDLTTAENQLAAMVKSKVYSHEDLMLSDRARLVLARLLIELGQNSQAFTILQSVTATDEYGAEAIANLIRLAIKEGDYPSAVNYSRYLIDKSPWHPATRDAHVGLPFALEKIHGSQVASGEYYQSALRLSNRTEYLTQLLKQLASSSVDQLVNVALSRRSTSESVLGEEKRVLAIEDVGHSDWVRWISSTRSQALANGWKSLNLYVEVMKQHREDMAILLLVDSEQKKRNEFAAKTLVSRGHGENLLRIQASTSALVDSLDNMLVLQAADTIPAFDVMKLVTQLATQPELADLRYIAQLKDRATLLGADNNTFSRIDRLKGVFLYRIQNELPVRVQQHRADLQSLAASRSVMQAKAQR